MKANKDGTKTGMVQEAIDVLMQNGCYDGRDCRNFQSASTKYLDEIKKLGK
jgi:hypothetical protein